MSTDLVSQLKIIKYPAACLRQKAEAIEEITDEVGEVAKRMLELMHEVEGVGLAAPQVNLSWRLFVTNSRLEDDEDRVYVNPVLLDPAGEWETHEEGCLSLPVILGDVRRPTQITLEAMDLEGKVFRMTRDDFLSRVWQHEYDHLNGVLIIDRFSRIGKMAVRRAVKDLEKKAED